MRGLDGFCNNSNNCLKRFLQMQFFLTNIWRTDGSTYVFDLASGVFYPCIHKTPLSEKIREILFSDWTGSGLQENER